LGIEIAKIEIVTRYAYDGWNPAKGTPVGTENFQAWATLDGSGSLTTRYLKGDVVDQVFARVDQNGAAWLYTDHLGSVRVVTDGNGNVIDQVKYESGIGVIQGSFSGPLEKRTLNEPILRSTGYRIVTAYPIP